MRKYLLQGLIAFVLIFGLTKCKKANPDSNVSPPTSDTSVYNYIDHIDKMSGYPGMHITIYTLMLIDYGTPTITFNGVQATVVNTGYWYYYNGTEPQLKYEVIIPDGATSGPIRFKLKSQTGAVYGFIISSAPKFGYLMVHQTNVDNITFLKLDDSDYTTKVFATSGTNFCDKAELKDYKIKVEVGKHYKLFADNSLIQWNINNVSVSTENECKVVDLSASNATSPQKGRIFFDNYESGLVYIKLYVDGAYIATIYDFGSLDTSFSFGTHSYLGIGHNGHTWKGTFTVENGIRKYIEFAKANAEPIPDGYCNIIIYRSVYHVPISVQLDNYDNPLDNYVGEIRGSYASGQCTPPLAVSVIRPLGVYNFSAIENLELGGTGGYWNGNINANVNKGCVYYKLYN